jgi:hypothetical protein
VALTNAVRPGVVVSTGIYWNKLCRGLSNVNSTTSSALTDMGGGATFFDNLVEVRAAPGDDGVLDSSATMVSTLEHQFAREEDSAVPR